MTDRRLLSLLGRWHQWRRAYSHERGYARAGYTSPADDEDELERMTMEVIEANVADLDMQLRLALQHIARAECLGVEVIMTPRLGNAEQRAATVEHALTVIERRLLRQGIL